MTPEELEALMALLAQQEGNGFSLAANAYGQGPGFMGLDEQPESWDRVGEKNDLLYDMTRTTGIDFNELVPGLHPMVQAPTAEQLIPYQSDTAGLYANNPVYQDILAQVQSGVSLQEALAAAQVDAQENPEDYAGYLPAGQSLGGFSDASIPGQIDWSQVRQDLETYIPEVQREQASRSQAEMLQQQYEDYIRPRSQWEMAGSPDFSDRRGDYAKFFGWEDPKLSYTNVDVSGDPEEAVRPSNSAAVADAAGRARDAIGGFFGSVGRGVTGIPGALDRNIGDPIEGFFNGKKVGMGQIAPGEEGGHIPFPWLVDDGTSQETASSRGRGRVAGARGSGRAGTPGVGGTARAEGPNMDNSGPLAVWSRIRQGVANANRIGESKPKVTKDWDERMFEQGYNEVIEKRKNTPAASKKEENLARLIAAYNSFHYGQ